MPIVFDPITPETEPAASTMTPPVRNFTATRTVGSEEIYTRTGIYYVAQDKETGFYWNHDAGAFEVLDPDAWVDYVKPLYYRGPGLWGAFVGADTFPAGRTLAIKVYSHPYSHHPRGSEVITDPQIGAWTTDAWPEPLPSTVAVDHDTGGTDALRVLDSANNPIEGVDVTAYLTSEYATDEEAATVRGKTMTDDNGRWKESIRLTPETDITIVFSEPGYGRGIEAITTPAIGGA